MARDIEEFLRRAAERRQQQKQGGAPKPPPRQQQQRSQPPRQQPPQRQPRREPPPVEAEIVDAVPVSRRRQKPKTQSPKPKTLSQQSTAEHLKTRIDVSDVSARADTLGDRIADVHDQVEANIHQRLDHDLTELDDTKSITELPPPKIFGAKSDAFAQELRQMLQNPKMVGKAIILADILKRPEI